jgi:hypothetical protein
VKNIAKPLRLNNKRRKSCSILKKTVKILTSLLLLLCSVFFLLPKEYETAQRDLFRAGLGYGA